MHEDYEIYTQPDGSPGVRRKASGCGALLVVGLIWCVCNAMSNVKHTFSQVTMEGPVVAQWHPSDRTVRLGVGKIENHGDGASGELSLKLWSCDKPYDGNSMNGELLATCEFKNRLDPQMRFEPSTCSMDVSLPKALDRPETILVALIEKKDQKETIVSSYNLKPKYTFRRDDWLSWWQKVPTWEWIVTLFATVSLAGGTVWMLRTRTTRE
ncbi:hypothetical protein EON81_21680 [bacterium]|nr:MAG: hypothetical protein EON81_21680 [bacterium]